MALEKIVKNSSGVPTGEYERIAGGTLYADNPIGAIVPFGGTDIPAGFLLCNGAEVLKTDYAELYAVIGDAFGTASVNTKFVLPDLREATTKGAGLTGKTVGDHLDADGLAVGEFLDDRVQTHEHYIGDSATPQHLGYSDRDGQNAGIGNRTVDATFESDRKWIALGQTNVGIARSGRYGDTTEVKSVGVNYIIKAKMVALPADLASGVEEYINDNATSEISSSNKLVTESDLTYSTSETNTGKTWIDGKPIYRKTVATGQLPNNTIKQTALGVTNYDTIVSIYGIAYKSSNKADSIPLPYPYTNGTVMVYTSGNASGLVVTVETVSNWTVMDASYVTVEYTKTTD